MAELKQLEFSLLRYVPDAVKGEFVNIGVIVTGPGGFAGLRFTRDWRRVRCMDADADLEMLEAIEAELRREISDLASGGRERMMKRLTDAFSNALELSPSKAVLAEDAEAELATLAELYLETAAGKAETPRERGISARRRLVLKMREAFDSVGVLALMRENIRVADYTANGDPLKLDFGYGINGDRPKTVKLFHAVAVESDADAAKVLAYSFPELARGIRAKDNAAASLTAIVSAQELDDERANFALDVLRAANIHVRPAAELPQIAEQARSDLKI